MQLNDNIHIWSAHLVLTKEQEKKGLALLSPDERERAGRFHFPLHRQRFIAARSALRQLISVYLSIPPKEIVFSYAAYKKPYLAETALQFNLSHSGVLAMIAFALNNEIGIDVEKIKKNTVTAIAERFFSPLEKAQLSQLPKKEQTMAFYRLWSRKEAIIKATGKGLSIPLSSFSVSIKEEAETIVLDNKEWSLLPLAAPETHQAAIAVNRPLHLIKLAYHEFL